MKTSNSDICPVQILTKMECKRGKGFDEHYTKLWHPFVNKLFIKNTFKQIYQQSLNNQTFKNG